MDDSADCDSAWNLIWQRSHDWEETYSDQIEAWQVSDDDYDRILGAQELAKSDPASALILHLELAETGSVWSMRMVGWYAQHGVGTSPDFAQAQEYYRRAIAAGSWMATLDYASLLVANDHQEYCERMLEDHVRTEFIPAYFWLAWYRSKSSRSRNTCREVRSLLEHAANHGHPAAKIILARWMLIGKFGLRDIPSGFRGVLGHVREAVRARREQDRAAA